MFQELHTNTSANKTGIESRNSMEVGRTEHNCFCLDTELNGIITTLSCCHQRVHHTCISHWFRTRSSCPYCRTPRENASNSFKDRNDDDPRAILFSRKFDRVQFLRDLFPYDAIPPPFLTVTQRLKIVENFSQWRERLERYFQQ